jgi:hypothetical protein
MGPQFGGGLATGVTGVLNEMQQGSPPVLPKRQSTSGRQQGAITGTTTNFGMAGLGAAAGIFSPWIGARLMNQSGIFNRLGAGGGGSGMMGALFGPGGYGGFGVAYLGLSIATRALKTAFEELKHSVERVAKLYQESAAINRPVGRIAQVQAGFAAIGLSADAAKRYAKSGPGGLNAEEMMQLTNMSDRFQYNMNRSAMDAEIISNASDSAQDAFEGMTELTREMHTLWVSMGPVIMETIVKPLTALASIMNMFQLIGQKMGIGATGASVNDKFSGMSGGQGMFNWNQFRQTSMERLGFTIGGNGVNSLLQRSNYYLAIIAEAAKGGIGGNNFGGGMATNLP